ncbi:MAG: hypothetical protein ACKO96_15775, partial [Flammeovirgaceae bacterium]
FLGDKCSIVLKHSSFSVILFCVTFLSFSIFEEIFYSADCHYKKQGREVSRATSSNGDGLDHLENANYDEVDVCGLHQLVQKVERKERE